MKARYAIALVALLAVGCEQETPSVGNGEEAAQTSASPADARDLSQDGATSSAEDTSPAHSLTAPPVVGDGAAGQPPTVEAVPEMPQDYEPPPEDSPGVLGDGDGMPMEELDPNADMSGEMDGSMGDDEASQEPEDVNPPE